MKVKMVIIISVGRRRRDSVSVSGEGWIGFVWFFLFWGEEEKFVVGEGWG